MGKRLLEKVVNCFIIHARNLNYGIVTRDYSLLKGAFLMVKNDITDRKYEEYFYNNLQCDAGFTLNSISTNMILAYTLNSSPSINNTFIWNETEIYSLKTYNILTTPKSGFNYIYISVPKESTNIAIYDEMNNNLTGEFQYVGEVSTSSGNKNNVYKKKNVFNSVHPVNFKIILT